MLKFTNLPESIKTPEQYYSYLNSESKKKKLTMEQEYCFFEFQDASRHAYEAILDICRRRGITEVHDIGCSYAFQAPMFANAGIVYLGIERDKSLEQYVPQGQNIFYKFEKYLIYCPPITKPWHTAAISSLCIGYLCNGDRVWQNMARTCEYFIGSIPENEYESAQKYYDIKQIYRYSEHTSILFCQRR